MSASLANPQRAGSYIRAALGGLSAGIGVAVVLVMAVTATSLPGELSNFLLFTFAATMIAGPIVGLPVAILFIAIMAIAERTIPHARSLPAWLLGGLVAATPLLALAVYWQASMGDATTLIDATVAPTIVIYSASLIAAATAWRMRHRSGL